LAEPGDALLDEPSAQIGVDQTASSALHGFTKSFVVDPFAP
jgi:hypothetical protein